MTLDQARDRMVEDDLQRRGITQRRVLAAFQRVRREAFVADDLVECAYDDTPLPIGEEQTISQPYVVALTVEALGLQGNERVLEVGTGSGYAAAILGELAREVYSVERLPSLASEARQRLDRLGYDNVHVLQADGSLGCPAFAPFDAIAVAAGAPEVPKALLEQLAPGGRLVLPVSAGDAHQELLRVTRQGGARFEEERLGGVRFVPLIGAQGYPEAEPVLSRAAIGGNRQSVARLIRESAEALHGAGPEEAVGSAAIDALVERVGDSRVVLLGEATHGTSEFYSTRARITRALIERKGFDFVAVEADWPDAALLNDRASPGPGRSALQFVPFTRFPTWMWRNQETLDFIQWLGVHNTTAGGDQQPVGFHGLDLYSMFTSISAVLAYLEKVDAPLAAIARDRYAALLPWQNGPIRYGQAVLVGSHSSAEDAVVGILGDLLARRLEYSRNDGERFFDAAQNARLVANAERYYRAMYHGAAESWNLRDTHMFETLESLLGVYGPHARGVIWAHNSHVGDATATEMGGRGELNVGQLCRARFASQAYIVGFGTDHGRVAAASHWGGPMRKMQVRPAHAESYEHLCHESERPAFVLRLRDPKSDSLRDELLSPRLERAIGVVYRPETELPSHYFSASLPLQFDEYVWFDETHPVRPLAAPDGRRAARDAPETFPFGL